VVILGAIVGGITAVTSDAKWGLSGGVVAVGFAIVVLVGFIKRVSTVYTITNQRLRIKRGILSKRIQQTRIDRVQNVNTDQSVVDRMLRVGTVDFDTAGTDDSDFTFVGVSNPSGVVQAVDRAHQASRPEPSGEPPL
jgi:uncharacterized membrane protein YdbT with pleckstrin-like domain